MRIAISIDKDKCSSHFGRCDGFKIFEINNGIISNVEKVEYPGHKPEFLPNFLKEKNINVIVSLGMGRSAQEIFKNENIQVIISDNDNVEEIVKDYIDGKLITKESICDKHEFHDNCND